MRIEGRKYLPYRTQHSPLISKKNLQTNKEQQTNDDFQELGIAVGSVMLSVAFTAVGSSDGSALEDKQRLDLGAAEGTAEGSAMGVREELELGTELGSVLSSKLADGLAEELGSLDGCSLVEGMAERLGSDKGISEELVEGLALGEPLGLEDDGSTLSTAVGSVTSSMVFTAVSSSDGSALGNKEELELGAADETAEGSALENKDESVWAPQSGPSRYPWHSQRWVCRTARRCGIKKGSSSVPPNEPQRNSRWETRMDPH